METRDTYTLASVGDAMGEGRTNVSLFTSLIWSNERGLLVVQQEVASGGMKLVERCT